MIVKSNLWISDVSWTDENGNSTSIELCISAPKSVPMSEALKVLESDVERRREKSADIKIVNMRRCTSPTLSYLPMEHVIPDGVEDDSDRPQT